MHSHELNTFNSCVYPLKGGREVMSDNMSQLVQFNQLFYNVWNGNGKRHQLKTGEMAGINIWLMYQNIFKILIYFGMGI